MFVILGAMENQQKSTNEVQTTTVNKRKLQVKDLDDRQLAYIDFTAVGGLITEEDGTLRQMTITQFAQEIGVDRTTLYTWRKHIPNFWDLVAKRRQTIGSQARTNKVWNGVYLRAAKGDAEQAKIWLSQFAGWQPPKQRAEIEHRGIGDLLNMARQRLTEIEGEIIENEQNTNELNNGFDAGTS